MENLSKKTARICAKLERNYQAQIPQVHKQLKALDKVRRQSKE